MCRFLMARSQKKIKPQELLSQFAQMCRKSRAPDGDWQGDGWGIALRLRSGQAIKNQNWQIYKSLRPIWEEQDKFGQFEETDVFVVHARSAGFPQHKGNIVYNQPYIDGPLCFVFNGLIRGVTVQRKLAGEIGAQKIFSLILEELDNSKPDEVLKTVDELIVKNSKKITGMNIGLVKNNRFYALCRYDGNKEYFSLHYAEDGGITLLCSEPIGKYEWKTMQKGEILVL
ncbi:hypothetical protein HYT17_02690 [Candidatus Microgenomates bacterium]|nr:hypothetical protein [Candidatus Microgenomates bacterium]